MEATTTKPTTQTIRLAGVELNVRGRLIEYADEIERAILAARPNLFVVAVEGMKAFADKDGNVPEYIQKRFIEIAMHTACENKVTRQQMATFLNDTLEGAAFMLWLAVRDNNPAVYTREHVRSLFLTDLATIADKQGGAARQARMREIEETINAADGGAGRVEAAPVADAA